MTIDDLNRIKAIDEISLQLFGDNEKLDKLYEQISYIDPREYKGKIDVCRMLYKLFLHKDLEYKVDGNVISEFLSKYYEITLVLNNLMKFDRAKWSNSGKNELENFNNLYTNTLSVVTGNSNFLIPILLSLSSLQTDYNALSEQINTDTELYVRGVLSRFQTEILESIDGKINALNSKTSDANTKYENLISQIGSKSTELDNKVNAITISASIKNVNDALEKTNWPLGIFVFVSLFSVGFVIGIIWHSYCNIDSVFNYIVTEFNKEQIELQKMYLIKNSLITLGAIALFSGIFTYSLKMVRYYLNIRAAYNHKLALLGSFDSLVSKEILNPQERHTVTETLIKQIISGENIGLGDNHASPSIVQSVIEKITPSTDSK